MLTVLKQVVHSTKRHVPAVLKQQHVSETAQPHSLQAKPGERQQSESTALELSAGGGLAIVPAIMDAAIGRTHGKRQTTSARHAWQAGSTGSAAIRNTRM